MTDSPDGLKTYKLIALMVLKKIFKKPRLIAWMVLETFKFLAFMVLGTKLFKKKITITASLVLDSFLIFQIFKKIQDYSLDGLWKKIKKSRCLKKLFKKSTFTFFIFKKIQDYSLDGLWKKKNKNSMSLKQIIQEIYV